MDEQMVPIVLGEAQKAVDIFEQTVDTLKKVDTIDALDKRFAAELGPQDPLGQVERVVNITTQMAELAKETETFPAIDKRIAEKIQPKPGKREVFEDIYKKMPTTANKFDENVGKVVDKSGEIIVTCLDAAFEKIKKELKTDHGSKVRAGRFYGCSIIYAGTKSCIVVDKEKHEDYVTFPRDDIARLSGMTMPINKRNWRKQEQHLKLARGQLSILREIGEVRAGRPEGSGTAQNRVCEWRQQHPGGRKVDCHRDTGLDPKTIRKWWDCPPTAVSMRDSQ